MSYSYRIQIRFPKDSRLRWEYSSYIISNLDKYNQITICSKKEDDQISNSESLIFTSHGFISDSSAKEEGEKVLDNIIRTFVSLKKGIDYGALGKSFYFTDYGLESIAKQNKIKRLLSGGLGLTVYKTEPKPAFASLNPDVGPLSPIEQFHNKFVEYSQKNESISATLSLAIHLYNSSFFVELPEPRFLLLIMAIEVLIQCEGRDDSAIAHVDKMIEFTCNNHELSKSDRMSMKGSLTWLKSQSIGQAGRELARKVLMGKKYNNMNASKFFTYCYGVRSALVHGNSNSPSVQELKYLATELVNYVSDLIVDFTNK